MELLAALGLGRSYGAKSRVAIRSLPGILQSGLWRQLDGSPAAPTRALITDVGNDILYGSAPERILGWVDECVARLQAHAAEVVLTDLPLASVRRLSPAKFLFFRTILYPPCRLSLAQALDCTERVSDGLLQLARRRGCGFFNLRPEWYGIDPIHFRPGTWRIAWQQILGGGDGSAALPRAPLAESLGLYLMRPEREWIAGWERTVPQAGRRLRRGARVWLY